MRILELVCDNCGKREKGDEYHYGLPKGWYIVGYHCQRYVAFDDWRVMGHFCCWECMSDKEKVTGNEEVAQLEIKDGDKT